MIWLKRRFAWADYAPYMDRVEKLLMANAALYQEFIMVSTETGNPGISDYFVGLPNGINANGFDGFELIEENALPKRIDTLHIADATKEPFRSRFHFEM